MAGSDWLRSTFNKRMHFIKTKQQFVVNKISANVFSAWKSRNTLVFFVFFRIMHFLFDSSMNAYKCHIVNCLLTSLARYVQRNIGPRPTGSVCTKKTWLRYFSVQTLRAVNKKLLFFPVCNPRSVT